MVSGGSSNNSNNKVRKSPRVSSLGLTAKLRGADGAWKTAKLYDLSVTGALLGVGAGAVVSQRLDLVLERISDGLRVELAAEIVRMLSPADPPRAAVRFRELSSQAASAIAGVLNEALGAAGVDGASVDDEPDEPPPENEPRTPNGKPLSTLRLHEASLYDLLQLDPACDNGSLESACERFIAVVTAEHKKAVGTREMRLTILLQSLERMRPLWNDPVKRARYDLRWGYFRVEQRLNDADSGAGVHAHILAGIWFELYPEKVREAERVMLRARREGLIPCLKRAIKLDPFNRRRRQRLAWLESEQRASGEGGPAPPPPPKEAPIVRGHVADLSLKNLLRAAAEDEEDVEIVVRQNAKAVGVVGFTRGDVVTAICGELRGIDAVSALIELPEGAFEARYMAPRMHLRHMQTNALLVLEGALGLGDDDDDIAVVDEDDLFKS